MPSIFYSRFYFIIY